jgi:hypothetical protein
MTYVSSSAYLCAGKRSVTFFAGGLGPLRLAHVLDGGRGKGHVPSLQGRGHVHAGQL